MEHNIRSSKMLLGRIGDKQLNNHVNSESQGKIMIGIVEPERDIKEFLTEIHKRIEDLKKNNQTIRRDNFPLKLSNTRINHQHQ